MPTRNADDATKKCTCNLHKTFRLYQSIESLYLIINSYNIHVTLLSKNTIPTVTIIADKRKKESKRNMNI